MIHALCSGDTCHTQAADIAHLRQQLATALGELATARAALTQAQGEVARLSGELQTARDSAAFHLAGFVCECRKAVAA